MALTEVYMCAPQTYKVSPVFTPEAPLIVLANRGSLGSQIQPYESTYLTAGASAPSTYNIDFSSSVAIDITGQRASSGDTLKLEYFRILHFVGD